MKKLFFSFSFLIIPLLYFTQNLDDLNKKELRNLIIIKSNKFDSLTRISEEINKDKEILEGRLKITQNKLVDITLIKDDQIKKKEEQLIQALDSLAILKKNVKEINNKLSENSNNEETKNVNGVSNSSEDFLNEYFFSNYPINNNTFEFSLSKIIIGNVKKTEERSYYDRERQENPIYIPEILNINQIDFFKLNLFKQESQDFNLSLERINVMKFNFNMPKIEILKNKLFTLKYNDSQEENFLFTLKELSKNNYRRTFQIQLASEEVKSDGTKNNEKDIIWTFLTLDNECYLALDSNQLKRINAPVYTAGIVEFYNNEGGKETGEYRYYRNRANGNGIYLVRKQDSFMDNDYYINPEEVIFLFKINPIN